MLFLTPDSPDRSLTVINHTRISSQMFLLPLLLSALPLARTIPTTNLTLSQPCERTDERTEYVNPHDCAHLIHMLRDRPSTSV